jgi:alpha-glucosidase
MLALPGGAYVYQGQELGLEEVTDLPEDLLQDPTWERSGRTVRGRDGCRVPIPWEKDGPSLGFGPGRPWLPQPESWSALSVGAQDRDPGSTLELYRTALRLRRELLPGEEMQWLESPAGSLAFRRPSPGGAVVCVVNVRADAVALPAHDEVLLTSVPLTGDALPADAAAWLRVS